MLLKEAGNLPVAIVRPSIGKYLGLDMIDDDTQKIIKSIMSFALY